MGGVSVGPRWNGTARAGAWSVTQRDHHAAAHSSGFKHLKRSPARGRAPPVHENMAKPLVTVAESIDLSDGDRREVGLEQVNQSRSREALFGFRGGGQQGGQQGSE